MTKLAIFAAGCFWGIEEKFLSHHGVLDTEVGYIGGITSDPTYHDVCSGETGHAEAVRVKFDEDIVSYEDLVNLVSGFEPIIMTSISKKKFCHRHLVAEWLENELGIIIEEYKVGKVVRSKGYMKKNINPTLF